jgi:hypothetical protein
MSTFDRQLPQTRLAPTPGRPSQRDLVAASLLLCPGKDAGARRRL